MAFRRYPVAILTCSHFRTSSAVDFLVAGLVLLVLSDESKLRII